MLGNEGDECCEKGLRMRVEEKRRVKKGRVFMCFATY